MFQLICEIISLMNIIFLSITSKIVITLWYSFLFPFIWSHSLI